MKKLALRLLRGALAGIAATAAMSGVMLGAKRLGALGEPPPRRIVRRLLASWGPGASGGETLDVAALGAHFAFGAAMGAVFSALPSRARSVRGGVLFGAGVWTATYAGALPLAGLMPPARRDRPLRPPTMVAAHLVYGAALALAERALWSDEHALRGRVVVVAGGTRGLGRALARRLLEAGAQVAICGRSPESLEHARDFLRPYGPPVVADLCDLRSEAQTRAFLRGVEQRLGPIDVLVANAATIQVAPIESLTPADFHDAMREIFVTALNPILAVLPSMQARRRGSLALVTSVGGRLGVPHLAPYTAAKFAQVGFAESLQAELGKDGVRVLTVAPGLMRTGSHWHATFKGNAARELSWFGASAVAPLLSIHPDRAARKIVRAIARGDRYLTFTPAARLGVWLHDHFPELWSALFSVAGRLLPRPPSSRVQGAALEGQVIFASSGSWFLDRLRRWTAPLAVRNGQ
jgi:NAD(P)-dependent dehydrogenase (short-subunit alcohol dehydrogenase family)